MKYIKAFEQNKEPQIGDYVILNVEPGTGLPEEAKNRIGEINDMLNDKLISVYYDDSLIIKFIHKNWIKYISKNKEDLEQILNIEKYNL